MTPRDPDGAPMPDPLAEANAVLDSFLPGAALAFTRSEAVRPHAVLSLPGYPRPLALIPNASGAGLASIGPVAGRVRLGGTAEAGIASLVRFARGKTRRPLPWWMAHFRRPTVEALLATSYLDDPAKVACVLCGSHRGVTFDWSGGPGRRRVGPVCTFGLCGPAGGLPTGMEAEPPTLVMETS